MSISRRQFIKNTAIAGSMLVIGFYIPTKARAIQTDEATIQPNAFIEIDNNNNITFIIGQVEMGQGIYTTLAMCIAEELDVKWNDIQFKPASVAPVYESDPNLMITGGSASVQSKQMQMRQIGATVRIMLQDAAAKYWEVPISVIETKESHVINARTGEKLPYGAFVGALSQMNIPTDVMIKPYDKCKLIGKPMKRHPKEAWSKVSGNAVFAIDVRLPNMKYAAVLHATVFGAKIKRFNADKALTRSGVVKVKLIPSGIAVIADKWWIAQEALKDIEIEWDNGLFAKTNTMDMHKEYAAMLITPGASARKDGNTIEAFKQADKIVEAHFDFPFLAHAPMEPLGVTVHHEKEHATIWSSSQSQTWALQAAIDILELDKEKITYETPYIGSAFGRRGVASVDFIKDGLYVAKNEPFPIMTLWSREDDIKGGYYRPMYKNSARLALDKNGKITAFEAKVVGQQILKGTPFEESIENGVEDAQVEGLAYHPYAIASNDIQVHSPVSPIPVVWWRSVGHTHTIPTLEGIIDEAAYAAKKDPITFRLENLDSKRHIAILQDVAEKSGWYSRKKEKGIGYGIAVAESFGSACAQVAMVRITNDSFVVEKVWCSIDCGFAFNPLNVENQMISAINFGIAALKYSEITIQNGMTVQSNYDDYIVSRISDAPEIEVSIVNTGYPVGGIGEPGVPPILAAVPNALFDASGKRYHTMPISLS
ncbi:MAG: molybdopterin-dependent oxidoreductase [Sulfuricurvum sp.]|nr:molybdopterin cofactor-binding domain-containing protein [Sulfuricurvum sp.]MDD2267317.1 molybdopterin-dependent oxidoreductase [Sulfuricurvum sp.]MDD2783939.1 molybdopterin-dependent oxidoreductase [Sulfuricurvum sp.]